MLLDDEIYCYDPSQFLAVSVDLPLMGQVLEATPGKPYLCLAIDLDARQFADLISQTGDATKLRQRIQMEFGWTPLQSLSCSTPPTQDQ